MDRPSSTSSSSPRWGLAWLLALGLTALALGALEWRWRALGHVPGVVDSKALWAIQRDGAQVQDAVPVLLLGASRIQAAVDPALLDQLAPGHRHFMLAVNGRYPLAVLRDLAADESFTGVVVLDVEANAFLPRFVDLQQPWVEYWHRDYTPSWRWHRQLLTHWQQTSLLADPRFSAVASLRHLVRGTKPQVDYVRRRAHRGTEIDYARTDTVAARAHFRKSLANDIAAWRALRPDPATWLADIEPVFDWARRIEARGGRVVFYQSPLHGTHAELWDAVYPPADYWDHFVATSPFPVLDGRAEPTLQAFELPDDSHLDAHDKAAFTRAWLALMHARGVLGAARRSTRAPHSPDVSAGAP